MIKLAALSITILLVGCSSVPPVIQEAESVYDKVESSAAGTRPAVPIALPPPMMTASAPRPMEVASVTTSISAHAANEIEEAKSTVVKIVKRLPKNAAVVVTEVAATVMEAAESATTTSTATITKYDIHGNVIEKREEHKESLMDFFNKLLDNMTKLIGLGTGALGLYVGFQKLRNRTVEPA